MSYLFVSFCRKSSILIVSLLLLQSSFGQYNFTKVDAWLKDNLQELGGRAVMIVYKDGKLVYQKSRKRFK